MTTTPLRLPAAGGPIEVTMPTRAGLMDAIEARLRSGEGFAVATVNLDHLVKMSVPGPFIDSYRAHEFIVADGNPIVWLSKIAGRQVELLPGSDLVIPLAGLAAEGSVPVALLGATQEVLDHAAETLSGRVQGLEIVARLAPGQNFDPFGDEADSLLDELEKSGARMCFLAIGAPKQECMAAHGRRRLPDVGFVSVGAGLDFLAGSQVRAPVWVRRLALEWVWRLSHSPRRLAARYLKCILILPWLVFDAWRQRGA